MTNSNKIFTYLVGLIFLIAGIGVALEILNIPFSSVGLLLVGIFIWCMYCKFNVSILKYLTCFFIPAGIGYFLLAAFQLQGIANFIVIYSSLICSLFLIYLFSRKKIFIFVTLAIAWFVLHTVTRSNQALHEFAVGYDCLYVGGLLTILFAFEHKTMRYTPILIAVIAYCCGLLNLLSAFGIITPLMFKLTISLLLLVLGGGIILYNYIKSKNDNKENNCE